MSDLVARLRRIARGYEPDDYGIAVNLDEAADAIDRLTAEVARLRQVLLTVSMDATDIQTDPRQLLNGIAMTVRAALPHSAHSTSSGQAAPAAVPTHPELEAAIKHITAFDDCQIGMLDYSQLWRLIVAARHFVMMLQRCEELQAEHDRLIEEVARLRHALRLARLYVAGAKCKSLRYENIVADDTRIVDEALARAAHKE